MDSHIELECNVEFKKLSFYPEEEGRPLGKELEKKVIKLMLFVKASCWLPFLISNQFLSRRCQQNFPLKKFKYVCDIINENASCCLSCVIKPVLFKEDYFLALTEIKLIVFILYNDATVTYRQPPVHRFVCKFTPENSLKLEAQGGVWGWGVPISLFSLGFLLEEKIDKVIPSQGFSHLAFDRHLTAQ